MTRVHSGDAPTHPCSPPGRRYTPYGVTDFKCTGCKSRLNKEGLYCHMCAYQKGLCEMCGTIVLENKNVYKQSKV